MCRRSARRLFLLLLLVLATGVSLTAGQDEEAEIENTEAEVEADIDAVENDSEENTTTAVAAVDGEAEDELTAETCEHPGASIKSKCCKSFLDLDDALIKCFLLHQKKMPKKSEQNPVVLVKFLSCLIECYYKAKKYMTKDETINMKMVKSDAKKLYKNKPKEQEFMIAQHEHCQRQAELEWGKLRKNPGARAIFKGACKPYYTFFFICVTEYGKVSCPHFKWSNTKEFKEECKTMKDSCIAIVG